MNENYNIKVKLDETITDIDTIYEILSWVDMPEPTTE